MKPRAWQQPPLMSTRRGEKPMGHMVRQFKQTAECLMTRVSWLRKPHDNKEKQSVSPRYFQTPRTHAALWVKLKQIIRGKWCLIENLQTQTFALCSAWTTITKSEDGRTPPASSSAQDSWLSLSGHLPAQLASSLVPRCLWLSLCLCFLPQKDFYRQPCQDKNPRREVLLSDPMKLAQRDFPEKSRNSKWYIH